MKFYDIMNYLRNRRSRVLDNKYNCLPFAFKRFRNIYPGFEKAKYILVSANQKIGKSKLCDYLFIYYPLILKIDNNEDIKLKVLYFTLEVSAKAKYNEFLCFLLYHLDNIIVDTKYLESTNRDNPVDEKILNLLETERYLKYINAFEEMVTYIDDIKNPTGINKYCREYALQRGVLNKIKYKKVNDFGIEEISERIDALNPFTLYKEYEEEQWVILEDNASNLASEKGMSKMETIDKMSKYNITLRDQLFFTVVLVQHQAQAQEGIENIKLGRLRPTVDGLADCKTTARDVNSFIGLFNPYKHKISEYEGYNITSFKDNFRLLEIIDDRDYGAGGNLCPLLFNGASSVFEELPLPSDNEGIEKALLKIRNIRNSPYLKPKEEISTKSFFLILKQKERKKNGKNINISQFRIWKKLFYRKSKGIGT